MGVNIGREVIDPSELSQGDQTQSKATAITSSSRDFDPDSDDLDMEGSSMKRQKIEAVTPVGFLDPLPPEERAAMQQRVGVANSNETNACFATGTISSSNFPSSMIYNDHEKSDFVSKKEASSKGMEVDAAVVKICKQFWKAGDYECSASDAAASQAVGLCHFRVDPNFLHSNPTSRKWAFGAFAELLDNALDEVSNGATYVHIDMLKNKKDNNAMLVIEDDGGGMTPARILRCMSFGFSDKRKLANTIGQYGNGFKTSTMRLGADAIVFSRCQGNDRKSATQSIGLLSYTFLRRTGKEDIVIPMIHYEKRGETWNMMMQSTSDDWKRNLETIVQWAPYASEEDLLEQFDYLKDEGTRIVIYNLREDDQGKPELDFDSDQHDIQISGVGRDANIAMAKEYPNSRHFLTYRHSLRSYAAILYLRIPSGFRILLRGKDVEHHNIVNDMMFSKEITYKPQAIPEEAPKDQKMLAMLTIGFVKDATYHIDIQGFSVYYKNRLIKPFWRVWNAAGSDGRGVIGVLEANFIEPARDKQSFVRTILFSRLESRLVAIQKNYWTQNCHLVGYAQRHHPKNLVSPETEATASVRDKLYARSNSDEHVQNCVGPNLRSKGKNKLGSAAENAEKEQIKTVHYQTQVRNACKGLSISGKTKSESVSNRKTDQISRHSAVKMAKTSGDDLELVNSDSDVAVKSKEENQELENCLEDVLSDLQFATDRVRLLENQLEEKENIIKDILEEMKRGDIEKENLRNKLKVASDTINDLHNKGNAGK